MSASDKAPEVEVGTVKFYREDRHFGFIVPDGGGADVFLPRRSLHEAGIETVRKGDRLEYELARDGTGWHARHPRLLGEAT